MDKQTENTYMNTNKVFDRMVNKSKVDSNQEMKSLQCGKRLAFNFLYNLRLGL